MLLPACGSGCQEPDSQPLDEGESVTVDVSVERGFIVSVIDVNGHFYRQPSVAMRQEGGGTSNSPSPSLATGPRERTALVTRDAAGLVMEVGEQSFRLDGPIRCE